MLEIIHKNGMERFENNPDYEFSGTTMIITLSNGIRKTFENANITREVDF